ncbi:MAG TPA: zinc-dependent metalloprotease, partial [Burkholderiaceae bacterium]|nr:zinc-dependent metalloprotease [Burkholderiaceae bacterium]
DLTNELGLDARSHYVNRWRLEKKDPQAALSEPRHPILVVMDSSIPVKYRPALRAGVLEWNKAFERIGFKNAIVIEQRADDAPTGADHRPHIAMRWFVMEGPAALAVGPSQTDPRTGEILQAAVIIPENWVRIGRTSVAETLPKLPEPTPPGPSNPHAAAPSCQYAHEALEQLGFGLDLLAARGVLDPLSPQADQFIFDSLKAVTLHEMGHALGLRHNFKASTTPTLAQLRDSAYVHTHGISSSVMDYNPLNLPLQNEPATAYNMTTLGAYDHWAIEYAYAPLAVETQDQQLAAIARRQSQDPALAYATDEDAMGALDPHINPFDLGTDPLAWYTKRLALTRELWARTESRPFEADESFALYRRNLTRGLKQYSQVAGLVLKYLGGLSTTRARAHGQASEDAHQPAAYGPALFEPIDPRVQREALSLLIDEYFAADNFRFDPQFMRRLGVNQLDRLEGDEPQFNTDFNLNAEVLGIQRSILGPLMSEALAQRLANAEAKVEPQALDGLLSYAHVQNTLRQAIWSELKAGGNIISMRRNLQREHIKLLATDLIKPTANSAIADVRSVHRQVASGLQTDLRRALARGKINAMTRAHLAEALATLTQALEAPLIKTGA